MRLMIIVLSWLFACGDEKEDTGSVTEDTAQVEDTSSQEEETEEEDTAEGEDTAE